MELLNGNRTGFGQKSGSVFQGTIETGPVSLPGVLFTKEGTQ
jgi:hypothetical protein